MAGNSTFCTWNVLAAQGGGVSDFGAIAGGGCKSTLGDTVFGTIGVNSGKWYWEWKLTGGGLDGGPGWANSQVNSAAELGYNSPASPSDAQCVYVYASTGGGGRPKIIGDGPKSASTGENVTYSTSVSNNVVFGLAADFDNNKWYYSIDGSFTDMLSGQNPATGANPLCSATGGGGLVTITRKESYFWTPAVGNWAASSTRESIANFGQDSTFGGTGTAGSGNADENGFGDFKYAVPTGFLALCSANLPVSTNIDPNLTDDDHPQKQFGVLKWTGDGTTGRALTGLGFQPDFIWFKARSSAFSNRLYDTSRGISSTGGKRLFSNTNGAESDISTGQDISAVGTDGITLGASSNLYTNDTNGTALHVAWCWRANGGTTSTNTDGDITSTVQANQAAGFSIMQWTGNGNQNQTIGHGLGGVPDVWIVKNRDATASWRVILSTTSGAAFEYRSGSAHRVNLDNTDAANDMYRTEGNFEPTSTTVHTPNNGNSSAFFTTSTNKFVGYCWRSIPGYSAFGKYEGNGNADGPFVYTGFKPRLVITKGLGTSGWNLRDSERSPENVVNEVLQADTSSAEMTSNYDVLFLSNGFKILATAGDSNTDGSDYVYLAWADIPFKYNNAF